MPEYNVGSGTGSTSSQFRCSAKPCCNFTTRSSAIEPWMEHASCAKHTRCSSSRTCEICSAWPETTWLGFDNWILWRKQRSQRDAANRARKATARAREWSESPPPSSPAQSERGCTRTRRTGTDRTGTAATVPPPAVTSVGKPKPKTPTKAALKSYDPSFAMRDPLMPNLEDDPLEGDLFDDFFGRDSGEDEILCRQRENLAHIYKMAEALGPLMPAQVGEPRAPLCHRHLPWCRWPMWAAPPQPST